MSFFKRNILCKRVSVIFFIFFLLAVFFTAGVALAADVVGVNVLENTAGRIVLSYKFGNIEQNAVDINGVEYTEIKLGRESLMKNAGAPELPDVSRSIIIPDDMDMDVNVLSSSSYEIADIDVTPSKGIIMRTTNPDDVPYTFGDEYNQDALYPGILASLRPPYILRDHRGVVVTVNPIQYNPVKRLLIVYTEMTIEVVPIGKSKTNVLKRKTGRKLVPSFHQIYKSHFLNYRMEERYSPLDEDGDMLIICHDAWTGNVQPLADHKTDIGIDATVVAVSTIGNTDTAIKAYIQSVYDSSDLAFVLLVGDAAQVATPSASGGASDPSYSKLAGSDDYPDILVGRFSAESAADVDTQVQRTIEYEQNQATTETWFWRGTGVASNQGTGDEGEYDDEHIGYIRDDLLVYGYTEVDEIYDPTGTASQVSTALNAGRGIINYCGHGSTTSWSSTGFSNTNVNALTNDNELPFIFSVACVNGNFTSATCFGEAWLRATNGSEPTGAIAAYMSSINQSWSPPMEAQDAFNLLYCAETYNTYGALCFAGSCSMMDAYGSLGVSMFNTWHIFGDPSLRIVGTVIPHTMQVSPSSGLISEGPNGGPFVPSSRTYTLTNHETFPIDFTVSESAPWLDLSSTGGTIPAEDTTNVTVFITGYADTMGNGIYTADVDFVNTTDHDGDCTRVTQLTVGVPVVQYEWNLNTDPGWSTEGEWQFGQPLGGGGSYGYPDPTGGATGTNVYGCNLSGDYFLAVGGPYNLTTGAIDCSTLSKVSLHFQRWLNSDYQNYVFQTIEASNNGSDWSMIWENGSSEIADNSWSEQVFDISAVADNEPTVYIRWSHEVGHIAAWAYSGWNIDDIQIYGFGDGSDPPVIDSITFNECISELCTSAINVTATDPAGGDLTYTYDTPDGGNIVGTGAAIEFDPPDTGPHSCPYQVKVTVTSEVSGLSVEETIDIYVKLAGDVDGNGVVNVLDKVQVRNHFGENGDSGWIDADVDCNGVVNVLDKVKVRNQFGDSGCSCPEYQRAWGTGQVD